MTVLVNNLFSFHMSYIENKQIESNAEPSNTSPESYSQFPW